MPPFPPEQNSARVLLVAIFFWGSIDHIKLLPVGLHCDQQFSQNCQHHRDVYKAKSCRTTLQTWHGSKNLSINLSMSLSPDELIHKRCRLPKVWSLLCNHDQLSPKDLLAPFTSWCMWTNLRCDLAHSRYEFSFLWVEFAPACTQLSWLRVDLDPTIWLWCGSSQVRVVLIVQIVHNPWFFSISMMF